MSRLRDHILNGPFAMMSAHRAMKQTQEDRAQNKTRQRQLKQLLRARGYGFIDTNGAWIAPGGIDVPLSVNENPILIPGIFPDEARELARLWEQHAVLLGQRGSYHVENVDTGDALAQGQIDQILRLVHPRESSLESAQIGGQSLKLATMEADPADRVYYVCSDPLPLIPLSGVMGRERAKNLPIGALLAYVPFCGNEGLRTAQVPPRHEVP